MKKVIIKTNRLCKSYIVGKQGNHVLKNIDLEIYDGDFTVIMGRSGSGKSTLLYSLSTMDQPTRGNIFLLDQDITKLNEKEITKIRKNKISFVFQSINLIPDMTALENVAYSGYGCGQRTKAEVNEQALELLRQFDLEEVKDNYPSEMSGGQQQRIAVARALITGSEILFGDEPTGALNSTASEQVLDLLTKINKEGQSIVMVTHDLKAARRATRLLYLNDGKIDGDLQLGTYEEQDEKARAKVIEDFLKERGW
ncbi:MAG: ABC transporter ATP-binding protein [Clostridiales bacterium]|nr:ABC transporter ATP-binding protein [Clostridiales bacterium]